MRSSIACARCRRSKIKCVNAGIDTTCRACESSGRECAYPTPAIGGGAAAAKRDLAALADGDERNGHPDWESPKRQRSRKSVGLAAAAAKEAAAKASLDALDAPVLTVKVWEAVFDLFQSHAATLLPFLHPASFLAQIRPLAHGAGPAPASPPGAHAPAPPPNPLIPLGVLALTARFHPTLVAYHAPAGAGAGAGAPDPLVASEVYATALRARLAGVDGSSLAVPDLTRVQALLMLALHEWGMCRGKSAWLYVGMAIRLAQALGLPWELEQDGVAPAAPAPLQMEAELFGLPRRAPPAREPTADDIIAQETKRRTFWACFLLDRCLSSGRYRPRMIRVRELGIQLPSDNAFAFGERVRTARLGEPPARRPPSFGAPGAPVIPSLRQSLGGFADDPRPGPASDAHHPPSAWSPVARRADAAAAAATAAATDDEGIDRWEVGAEESVLGRVIRIVRLWGSIAQWSCAGGRRTEPVAPWHPESRFAHLRTRLAEFQDGLARNLQYSSRNTETHIMYRHSLAPYTVMHVVYFLSVIVLHRAYIPFLPVHCPGPVGPLDEPGAVATDPTTAGGPDGFWRDSARELFGAARRMMDLVLTCQERGVLVENPLVGFAVYHAAFVSVYAAHFPHMDPDGALRPPPRSPTPPDAPRAAVAPSPARQMLDLLRRMRPRLRMARGWFRTVNRLHSYFAKVRRDVRRHTRRPDGGLAADDAGPDGRPVREGGAGGGLDEFRLIEKLFLDFGTIEDQLPETGSDASGDGGPVVAATTALPAVPPGPLGSDRATNPSDAGSSVARSETGDAGEEPSADGGIPPSGRRESWVPVNSPGLPPRGPDGDRRPSLPLPTTSRSLQSQSPFSLPALPPPPPPPVPADTPLYGHPSPTLPSIGTASSQAPRLQPLNSWLPPRGPPPPYAQSLPPISATTAHGLPLLPPPGAVGGPGGSSPGTDGWDSLAPPPGLWSTSLGGEDVLAFLEGCDYDQLPSPTASELGLPTGWLSTVWTEFAR